MKGRHFFLSKAVQKNSHFHIFYTHINKQPIHNFKSFVIAEQISFYETFFFFFKLNHSMSNIVVLTGTWTPQGQFIQQIPPHQLEDLRYHHPQYTSVTTYHQPATGQLIHFLKLHSGSD